MVPRYGITEQKNSYGVSLLAALSPSFPCHQMEKLFSRLPEIALSILWGTFGSDTKCLRSIGDTAKKITLLIHFSNETCRRIKKCSKGEFFGNYSIAKYEEALALMRPRIRAKIRGRVRQINRTLWKALPPNTSINLSTGLESDFGLPAAINIAKMLKRVSGYEIVYNPLLRSRSIAFGLHESHDVNARCGPGDIFVNDGTDVNFPHRRSHYANSISVPRLSDVWARNEVNGCRLQLFWWGAAQGRELLQFTDPRNRHFRLYSEDVRIINELLRRQYVDSE